MTLRIRKASELVQLLEAIENSYEFVSHGREQLLRWDDPNSGYLLHQVRDTIMAFGFALPVFRKYQLYTYLGYSDYPVIPVYDNHPQRVRYSICTDRGEILLPCGFGIDVIAQIDRA